MASKSDDIQVVRVYKYGAKPPKTNADEVRRQARLAHEYYNKLVELERARRDRVEALVASVSGDIVEIESRIAEREQAEEDTKKAIGKANSEARRKRATPVEKSVLKTIRAELKVLRAKRKELRAAAFKSDAFTAASKAIEMEHTEKSNALNIEYGKKGVFWGTRQIIDKATRRHPDFRKGAPPKFKRWDGCFAVGVQIQGEKLTSEDVFVGRDTRFQIDLSDDKKKRTLARIRIGSLNAKGEISTTGGATPIWAEFRTTIHRNLPVDAQIQRVEYHCTRIGRREEWTLHITVKAPASSFDPGDRANSGVVTLDLAWRNTGGEEGKQYRAAYWKDEDGNTGEITLPAKLASGFDKCQEVKSIRDLHVEGVKSVLIAWLKGGDCPEYLHTHLEKLKTDKMLKSTPWASNGNKDVPAYLDYEIAAVENLIENWGQAGDLPEELKESVSHIHAWKGANRIHGLLHRLRAAVGDDIHHVLMWLQSWAKRDDVLNNWHSNADKKLRRWRDDIYKKFAAQMRRKYKTCVLEDINLREMAKDKGVESHKDTKNAAAGQRQKVAPSILAAAISHTVRETVKVNCAYTSQECTNCGHTEKRSEQMLECPKCGHMEDRDDRACTNLFERYYESISGERTASVPSKPRRSAKTANAA